MARVLSISSRFSDFLLAFRGDSVAIFRFPLGVSCRFRRASCRFRRASCRFRRVASCRSRFGRFGRVVLSISARRFVAIFRFPLGVSCRFRRASCRFRRASRRSCRFGRVGRDLARVLSISARRVLSIRSISARRSCRFVAIFRLHLGVSCRHPSRHPRQDTKKARFPM